MRKLRILVIDGQGGRIGKQVIEGVRGSVDAEIIAVGTNSAAAATMLKAGADNAATGENAVAVNCRWADVIIGPVGVVIADALLGEITPPMAVAVGQSGAVKLLIPVNHCGNIVVGVPDLSISRMVAAVVEQVRRLDAERA